MWASTRYRILRVRFNVNYIASTDYIIERLEIGNRVLNTAGDTWYYITFGGFYNFEDVSKGSTSHQFLLHYGQRYLIETVITEVYLLAYGIRKSDGVQINITSEPIALQDSMLITIDELDFANTQIKFRIEPKFFLFELFYNLF